MFPPEPLVSAMLSKDIAGELVFSHRVVVLCPAPTRPEGFVFGNKTNPTEYEVKRVNSYTCPSSTLSGRLRESYSFGAHCARYIKEHSKEIYCIYINSWPLFSQYLILRITSKLKIPTILHIQDIYPESLTDKLPKFFRKLAMSLLLPLDNYILTHANRIICISPNMISYLSNSRKIDANKFDLIRNWQNDAAFLLKPENRRITIREDFVFMYVGSISPSAGVDLLINAFHGACLSGSRLIVAGNGSDKQKCISLAQELRNSRIEFWEVMPHEVPELQSQADVLLLPLKKGIGKTATPSKLTAYLLSSRPVIACVENDTDVADIIRNANCGFIVEPENAKALSYKMIEMYNWDREKLLELGKKGREYALLHLSKKANLQKMVSVIEQMIYGNKGNNKEGFE